MLKLVRSGRFKRDLKRMEKRGNDMRKLYQLITLLQAQQVLPVRYRDHPLKGDYQGLRDAHIEPDWLLIYQITGAELLLSRTGSHADLFGK